MKALSKRSSAQARERLGELRLALAAETDQKIGGDGQLGHGSAQIRHQLAVFGEAVAASHAFEHGVRRRLQRQVHVLAHLGQLGHGGDDLGGEAERVGRHEAYALDARRPRPRAASSSAKPISRPSSLAPYELTVCPSSCTSRNPLAARART